ncbi:MAG: response regulator [Myxococcaceae bacterium]|nr:response regulator [Myxococcaceae bacterium]
MKSPANIVVVEDDPGLRHSFARMLRAEGHVVLEMENGRTALAEVLAKPPDLLITDVNMPEFDGLELIRGVRKRHPDLPIIAMTVGGALPTDVTLDAARLLGAHATFDKLTSPKVLVELVARILA